MTTTRIVKRDGRAVDFDVEKVASAIYKAAKAIGGHDYQTSRMLANPSGRPSCRAFPRYSPYRGAGTRYGGKGAD